MCDGCNLVLCSPRCPKAEGSSSWRCSNCGGEIWKDMEYFQSDDGPVCEECLSIMPAWEIIKMVGGKLSTAKEGFKC